MSADQEVQLELFERLNRKADLPTGKVLGLIQFRMRYDQVVLTAIACLIVFTVVFAFGVERGKQLARFERPVLEQQASAKMAQFQQSPSAEKAIKNEATEIKQKPIALDDSQSKKVSVKTASDEKSRYAIQVVTYSQAFRAQRELQRLQANGERAFLLKRQGRVIVYVGPFPSKSNAGSKLSRLKAQYQDCFLKTL